ncbi:MAG: transporter [Sphingomonadaceae bacterium]|jgi:Putative MetA-pathway of phenol degradation|nr:transporter [Sphingomonadaceae bacterium]
MTRAIRFCSALALLASASIATPALAEDYTQFSLGLDYSEGDYGITPDTKIVAVPIGIKLQRGDFFVRASLPWLHVDGPAVPGDGGALPGPGGSTSRSGIGDLSLAAGYSLPVTDTLYFDMIGKVKLPTASESKGLGTGTTDFTAEAELTKVFGQTSVSLRGGRRFNGSSAAFPLQDVWQAGAGIYHTVGKVTLGLDYDWRDAALPTLPNRSELTGSLGYKLTDAFRLQGYAYTGLSDGSPNIGGGLQLVYRIGK